jgi:hypothetical protein
MNNLRKIVLYVVLISFPAVCFADNFGWKSIVDFAQHNKAVISLGIAGVSGFIGGALLSKKLNKDRAFANAIKARADEANIAIIRAQYLKNMDAELTRLEKNRDTENFSKVHANCAENARKYCDENIKNKNFVFSDSRVEDINTLFLKGKATKGDVKFRDFNNSDLNISQIQIRERFTWLPKAAFAVGGVCLLGAFGSHEITKSVAAAMPHFPSFFPAIQDTTWNKNNRA